jgi:hypothetical protein
LHYGCHIRVRKIIENLIVNLATEHRDRIAMGRPREKGRGEEVAYRYLMRAWHFLRLCCPSACHHQNGRPHDTQQSQWFVRHDDSSIGGAA